MPVRMRLSSALLLCASCSALASEGMVPALLYPCIATEVNEIVASVCGSHHPELRDRSLKALSGWRERNVIRAPAAAKRCTTNLQFMAGTEYNAVIDQVKHEYLVQ